VRARRPRRRSRLNSNARDVNRPNGIDLRANGRVLESRSVARDARVVIESSRI